jgi:hypothetical protein
MFQLRSWPAVREFLGDGIKIEPLVGEFVRIKGSVRRRFSLALFCSSRHYWSPQELVGAVRRSRIAFS